MLKEISYISIVVSDYDEAIKYYTKTLGFELVEDLKLSEIKRWVLVSPNKESGCRLLLAKAATEEQKNHIGNQTGGRVFLFLETDDFQNDYERMKQTGVDFIEAPRQEDYGKVVVFKDLYGNKWDLLEFKNNGY
jgi:uncharacterized glyoxalase superfamily protein PhnB